MPIGAISVLAAVFASGGILAPVLVLSGLGAGIFVGFKSVLILLLFAVLFLIPLIFVRPLESIEGRNEKKKVGNYLIFASFFTFVFFGFTNGIYSLILTYLLYKIFVNFLSVLKNDDEKIVFSKEENIVLYAILSLGIIYISILLKLPLIIPILLIMGILGYASIRNGIIESLLSLLLILFISKFLILPNYDFDYLTKYSLDVFNIGIFNLDIDIFKIQFLILTIIVLSIISLLRRFSRIVIYYSIALLNIILFFVFYKYVENIIYYIPYLFMSIIVVIVAEDYASIKDKKLRDSGLISDEGETRLETEVQSNKKDENADKDKIRSREIVELFNDKDLFVNRMYTNKSRYKNLSLYDEIQDSDYIIEEIYYLIKEDGYIDRTKFSEILVKNNVIIDIYSYEMEEEIRILEILALRELKNIIRQREEKEILNERERLQKHKKDAVDIEETKSIAYNNKREDSVKKISIRNLKQEKDSDREIVIESNEEDINE